MSNKQIIYELDKIQNISKNQSNNNTINANMYIKCIIHELNTPITSISIGLNIMENIIIKDINNNNSQALLSIIQDLYKTIHYIENTLTKFFVIQDGKLSLNKFTPFNIINIIKNIKKIILYDIKEKNISFEYNIDLDIHKFLYGDKINIEHCIFNLIKNSIKYSNLYNNNNKIIVKINRYNNILIKDEEYIIISISDNNNHILPHIQKKLFQPFNSTSGSGLGLYICKQIITLHGGFITYEELKHQEYNNQFNIILKFKKYNKIILKQIINSTSIESIESLESIKSIESIESIESIKSLKNITSIENITSLENIENLESLESLESINDTLIIEYKKYNIIIVDDSEISRKMMQNIFKNNCLLNNIYLAIDGLDAINQICNNKNIIDIIIIDNYMPNLSGMQTVQLLRGINFNNLIFGITGSDKQEIIDFKNSGVDYIFIKPFDKNKIKLFFDFLNKKNIVRYKNKKLTKIKSQLVWI